jgi:hypothetical protein
MRLSPAIQGLALSYRRRHGRLLEAEAGSDVDVVGADSVAAVEVGDRSRYPEHAGVASGAEAVAVVELVQEPEGARGRRA